MHTVAKRRLESAPETAPEPETPPQPDPAPVVPPDPGVPYPVPDPGVPYPLPDPGVPSPAPPANARGAGKAAHLRERAGHCAKRLCLSDGPAEDCDPSVPAPTVRASFRH